MDIINIISSFEQKLHKCNKFNGYKKNLVFFFSIGNIYFHGIVSQPDIGW